MAYGGGTWTTQNKILPGSYINVVSRSAGTSELGERGVAAIVLPLDWGEELITVTADDFNRQAPKLFGYPASSPKLAWTREILKHARKVYIWNSGVHNGTKASCKYGSARYAGERGNDLTIGVEANPDKSFTVRTLLAGRNVDTQTVAKFEDLKDNDFITWSNHNPKQAAGTTLEASAGVPLTGGKAGEQNAEDHTRFMNKLDQLTDVNTIGYAGDNAGVKKAYAEYTKRKRDDEGIKFQTVLYDYPADYEGIINVASKPVNAGAVEEDYRAYLLVPWVTGLEAGLGVNESGTARDYDGEFVIDTEKTQTELEDDIEAGRLVFHRVGDKVKVLKDINSLTSFTERKGKLFSDNQTIRLVDEIATATARIFDNEFLGKVPNDQPGRLALRDALADHREHLQSIRAIEGYDYGDTRVEEGDDANSVLVTDKINRVDIMETLYCTVVVQ